MSWGPQRGMTWRMVSVDLDFDSVEFIAMDLPQSDGFTRDWWTDVYLPMVKLREEREREYADDQARHRSDGDPGGPHQGETDAPAADRG